MSETFDQILSGWEPHPLFHVYCLQGVPAGGWIHDLAVWSRCVEALEPLVALAPELPAITTAQFDGGESQVRFPKMSWRAEDHRLWTTRLARMKHSPNYTFYETRIQSPSFDEQQHRSVNPQLWMKAEASLPCEYWGKRRGARHQLLVALRTELALRLEPEGLPQSLSKLALALGAHGVWWARRKDLENLRVPGHPSADELSHGETAWTPMTGIPLVPCRDDVESAPDTAGLSRTFTHADGRTIGAGAMPGGLQLTIRDADGDSLMRWRPAKNPEAALAELEKELSADGFVAVQLR